MKRDLQLRNHVLNVLQSENVAFGLEIKSRVGIITLSGSVDCYRKKIEANYLTNHTNGVKGVLENIEVNLPSFCKKDDFEILHEVEIALTRNLSVPAGKVIVNVKEGWITMEGELNYNYQREAAKNAINYLDGVRGLTSNIIIAPEFHQVILQRNVDESIEKCWWIKNENIEVSISGSTVKISGSVPSWNQKQEVGRLVWATPGISNLHNKLEVNWD